MSTFIIIALIIGLILWLANSRTKSKSFNPPDPYIESLRRKVIEEDPYFHQSSYEEDDDLEEKEDIYLFPKDKVWEPGEPYMIIGDVETSGLRKYRSPDPMNLSNWPRIVQISYHVFDKDGVEIYKENVIFKQPRPLPPDSIAIHGITDQMCKEFGVKPEPVLSTLYEYSKQAFFFVGHNADFDLGVIEANMRRFKIANDFRMYSQCTMIEGKKLKGLTSLDKNGRKKNPRLEEVYEFLFGEKPEKQHDAAADTAATIRCYFEMKSRGMMD